jgi:ribosome-binding factor A
MSVRDRRRARRLSPETSLDPSLLLEAAGHRQARLQHLIHEELGALLRDDVRDPVLRDLQLVAVELSVDYRNARVVVAAGAAPAREVAAALERAAGFLRARLSEALDLKHAPQLTFRLI